MAKYDDLMNKHVMLEKELVTLKSISKSEANVDEELITSFKKRKETVVERGWKLRKKRTCWPIITMRKKEA